MILPARDYLGREIPGRKYLENKQYQTIESIRCFRSPAGGGWELTRKAPYPSGKGEVCKTFMQRFESARRLQITPAVLSVFLYCITNLTIQHQ